MAAIVAQFVSWPGAISIASCTYCASHGISPGQAIMVVNPQPNPPAEFGSLVFSDGVNNPITIPDCKVDRLDVQIDGGGQSWVLTIVDRRWRWRFGFIQGSFNQLDPHGKLLAWTIRSPTELATFCLNAMGETNYTLNLPVGLDSSVGQNVTQFLPTGINWPSTGTNPPVNWNGIPPATALNQLADQYGCRVIYDPLTDSILVGPVGFGAQLPPGHLAKEGPAMKAPETPDSVCVLGGPIRFQMQLDLAAVGEEWDGSYRPINELSYAPLINKKPDWSQSEPPEFGNVLETTRLTREQARNLAKKTVFRVYQLSGLDVSLKQVQRPIIPGYGPVLRKQQIVMTDTQCEQVLPQPGDQNLIPKGFGFNEPFIVNYYNGYSRDKPAAVYGAVCQAIYLNTFITANANINTDAAEQIYLPFSVDPVWQTITFSDYVFYYDPLYATGVNKGLVNNFSKNGPYQQPVLTLQTAVHVRDPFTNQLVCYAATLPLAGGNARATTANVQIFNSDGIIVIAPTTVLASAPYTQVYSDVQLEVIGVYNDQGQITKVTLLNADPINRANYYLNGLANQFWSSTGLVQEYNGLVPISLDGAIQQVTWTIGESGCNTTASRNTEHNFAIPPYPARRWVELLPPVQQGQLNQARDGAVLKPVIPGA